MKPPGAFKTCIFKIAILFLVGGWLTSACSLQDVRIEDVRSIEFTHLSVNRIGLNVHIPIHNPNNFSFKVTGIDLDVLVNGMDIGKITNSGDVKILKQTEQVYSFPVDVTMDGLVRGAMALISVARKDHAIIRVQGELEIKYPFGKRTFPVASENDVQIL